MKNCGHIQLKKLLKITRSLFEYRSIIYQTTLFDENLCKFSVKDESKTAWLETLDVIDTLSTTQH